MEDKMKFLQGMKKYGIAALTWSIAKGKKLLNSSKPAHGPVRPKRRIVGSYGPVVVVLLVLTIIGLKFAFDAVEWTFRLPGMSAVVTLLVLLFVALLIYLLATKPNFRKKCADNWKPIVGGLVPVALIVAILWFGKTMVDDFKESRKQDRLNRVHAAAERKEFCGENPQAFRCFPLDTVFVKTATSSSQARIVVPPGYSAEWVYDTLRVEWPKETVGQINKKVYFRVKPGVDSASIEFHLWRTS
jgi:hypothetical protein